jgi:hypothetical protein
MFRSRLGEIAGCGTWPRGFIDLADGFAMEGWGVLRGRFLTSLMALVMSSEPVARKTACWLPIEWIFRLLLRVFLERRVCVAGSSSDALSARRMNVGCE